MSSQQDKGRPLDSSIGRIVSVTGSKAIVLLDGASEARMRSLSRPPGNGNSARDRHDQYTVLAIVSALSVPVPSQREGDNEVWIAELGLVGELLKAADTGRSFFNRGVTVYPGLGDRVRVAVKAELEVLSAAATAQRCVSAPSGRTARSRQWSASTSCSASTSPCSARPAPASRAPRR